MTNSSKNVASRVKCEGLCGLWKTIASRLTGASWSGDFSLCYMLHTKKERLSEVSRFMGESEMTPNTGLTGEGKGRQFNLTVILLRRNKGCCRDRNCRTNN